MSFCRTTDYKEKMKLSAVVLCVLVGCVVSLAVEHGPLVSALQPRDVASETSDTTQNRDKRGLALLGAGAIGAGILGAGALGLGAGVIGAKAGFIGGALASGALHGHGRSYGGYGGYYGGGGYYSHGGYGSYGGYRYGHGYRSYYPSTYVISSPWYY